MRKLLTLMCLAWGVAVYGQSALNVQTDPGTAQDLIDYISGEGVEVSNPTLDCANGGYGSFSNGLAAGLGIDEGILLTTGAVDIVASNSAVMSQGLPRYGDDVYDPDLTGINAQASRDVCILEFDILPLCDTLQISYIFASEEYPEFVCSDYNDVFGFFIWGANPTGGNYVGRNLALVPGTNTPVAINTVNNGIEGGYSNGACDGLDPNWQSYTPYYIHNEPGQHVVYDGYTVPLDARVPVVRCESYHVKMAIADVLDYNRDSGVFIERLGLSCPIPEIQLTALQEILAEGCQDGLLEIARTEASDAVTLNLTVAGDADLGVDFNMQTTVEMAAGVDRLELPLEPITDGVDEGVEEFEVILEWEFCDGRVSVQDTARFRVTEGMDLTITGVNPECPGDTDGSITAEALGGTNIEYSLNDQNNFGASGVFDQVGVGDYVVYARNAEGCEGSAPISIVEPDPIQFNTLLTEIDCHGACNGVIAFDQVSGGTAPITFSIDGGGTYASDSLFEDLCAGVYPLRLLDSRGCEAEGEVTLIDPAPMQLRVTSVDAQCADSCDGSMQAIVEGGIEPYTYTWSGGVAALDADQATEVCAGSYDLQVEDASGCVVDTLAVLVAEPQPLEMTFATFDPSCYGYCDGSATVIPTGGTAPYQYLWSDGLANLDEAQAVDVCAGIYSLTIQDLNGCTVDTLNFVVDQPDELLVIMTSATDELCLGQCNGALEIQVAAADSYTLDGVTQDNGTFTDLCSGDHVVTATQGTCTLDTTIRVGLGGAIEIDVSADTTICIGGDADLSSVVVNSSVDIGLIEFIWNDGEHTGSDWTVSPGGEQTYTVYAEGGGCTSLPVDVVVSLYPPLNLTVSPDVEICPGETVRFKASVSGGIGPEYTFLWEDEAGNQYTEDQVELNPDLSQTLTLTVGDGCTTPQVLETREIVVHPVPGINLVADTLEGCSPLAVHFENTAYDGDASCFWDFGDGTQSDVCSPDHVFTAEDCYDVFYRITTPEGCSDSVTVPSFVCDYPTAQASFEFLTEGLTIFEDQFRTWNSSLDASEYTWIVLGDGDSTVYTDEHLTHVFNVQQETQFEVCLIADTPLGCVDSTCKSIVVEDIPRVYVPNAFTPDGTGINDMFTPILNGFTMKNYQLYVFNRWGQKIFESGDLEYGWDGRFKGQLCQQDVYVWKVVFEDVKTKQIHRYVGHVTLIK